MSVDAMAMIRGLTKAILALSTGAAFAQVHAAPQSTSVPLESGIRTATSGEVFDPLRTQPAVLDRGATLPGDGSPIECDGRPALPLHPLSLGEAVDLALCNSAQVQLTWAGIKLQAAQLGQSRASWLPTVTSSISAQRARTTYPEFPASDNTQKGNTAYADVTWRLFDFGARSASDLSALRLLDAALASHDAALQKTLDAVVQAYFDAVTARAAADGRAQAALYALQTYEATQRRESRGAAPIGDTLQANVAYAKARLAEQRAKGDFRKALSVLLYACGLPPEAEVDLAKDSETVPAQALADLTSWLDMAASHPAVLAAKAQVDAAEAKVDVTRAQGMPSIDFSGNYYRNGYPNQGLQSTRSSTTTIGITLTIPLFEGFARTYQINGARAQVEQLQAQLRDTRLQLFSSIVKDHADAAAALANLQSSATLLNAAEAAVDSSRKRYDHGEGDILELLAAQSASTDALQERIRCVAEWRSARLRLFADAGVLGRAGVAEKFVAP